jgi:hypothetical protein
MKCEVRSAFPFGWHLPAAFDCGSLSAVDLDARMVPPRLLPCHVRVRAPFGPNPVPITLSGIAIPYAVGSYIMERSGRAIDMALSARLAAGLR